MSLSQVLDNIQPVLHMYNISLLFNQQLSQVSKDNCHHKHGITFVVTIKFKKVIKRVASISRSLKHRTFQTLLSFTESAHIGDRWSPTSLSSASWDSQFICVSCLMTCEPLPNRGQPVSTVSISQYESDIGILLPPTIVLASAPKIPYQICPMKKAS